MDKHIIKKKQNAKKRKTARAPQGDSHKIYQDMLSSPDTNDDVIFYKKRKSHKDNERNREEIRNKILENFSKSTVVHDVNSSIVCTAAGTEKVVQGNLETTTGKKRKSYHPSSAKDSKTFVKALHKKKPKIKDGVVESRLTHKVGLFNHGKKSNQIGRIEMASRPEVDTEIGEKLHKIISRAQDEVHNNRPYKPWSEDRNESRPAVVLNASTTDDSETPKSACQYVMPHGSPPSVKQHKYSKTRQNNYVIHKQFRRDEIDEQKKSDAMHLYVSSNDILPESNERIAKWVAEQQAFTAQEIAGSSKQKQIVYKAGENKNKYAKLSSEEAQQKLSELHSKYVYQYKNRYAKLLTEQHKEKEIGNDDSVNIENPWSRYAVRYRHKLYTGTKGIELYNSKRRLAELDEQSTDISYPMATNERYHSTAFSDANEMARASSNEQHPPHASSGAYDLPEHHEQMPSNRTIEDDDAGPIIGHNYAFACQNPIEIAQPVRNTSQYPSNIDNYNCNQPDMQDCGADIQYIINNDELSPKVTSYLPSHNHHEQIIEDPFALDGFDKPIWHEHRNRDASQDSVAYHMGHVPHNNSMESAASTDYYQPYYANDDGVPNVDLNQHLNAAVHHLEYVQLADGTYSYIVNQPASSKQNINSHQELPNANVYAADPGMVHSACPSIRSNTCHTRVGSQAQLIHDCKVMPQHTVGSHCRSSHHHCSSSQCECHQCLHPPRCYTANHGSCQHCLNKCHQHHNHCLC